MVKQIDAMSYSKDQNGSATPAPVWLLLGHKAGDNNQVLALAESLQVTFEAKHLRYRRTEIFSNLLLGPNLQGIEREARTGITAPWPRLVISAGRRNEPVARWIKAHAPQPVKIVHIGRPWADPGSFDLIVTTPQYQLPDAPNVLRFDLPLHRIAGTQQDDETATWKQKFSHLPKPWFAVLIGGESGRLYLSNETAKRIADGASELAARYGGSLLITTSARSPQGAAETIDASVTVPRYLFDWHPDAGKNPYRAFLALADSFVVTSDSMSMLAEACAMRRPVYIFDMNDRTSGETDPRCSSRLKRLFRALRYRSLTHNLAQHLAPIRMRRDVRLLHEALIRKGRAVWLGQAFATTEPPPLPDTGQATRRVLELLGEPH
jgi:mitochondrial fission protein ELM1